jgi:hypothetical protein
LKDKPKRELILLDKRKKIDNVKLRRLTQSLKEKEKRPNRLMP